MTKEAECYVDETGQGHFCCPLCGMVRCISVAERDLAGNRFADTCACGVDVTVHVFLCVPTFSPLQLTGSCRVKSRLSEGRILITELHFMAVHFVITSDQRLFPGDPLELAFRLKNAERTPIALQAMVTEVNGIRVEAVSGEVTIASPDTDLKLKLTD